MGSSLYKEKDSPILTCNDLFKNLECSKFIIPSFGDYKVPVTDSNIALKEVSRAKFRSKKPKPEVVPSKAIAEEKLLLLGQLGFGPVLASTLFSTFSKETPLTELSTQGRESYINRLVRTSSSAVIGNFLDCLIAVVDSHPVNLCQFLESCDSNGSTVGHAIASKNHRMIGSKFLKLLTQLAPLNPEFVLNLLKRKDNNGEVLLLLFAKSRDAKVQTQLQHVLSLLYRSHPDKKIIALFSLQTTFGDTIGHYLTAKNVRDSGKAYLEQLISIAKHSPDKVLKVLFLVNKNGATIGHYFAGSIDTTNTLLFLQLLLVLAQSKKQEVLNLLKVKYDKNNLVEHLSVQDEEDNEIYRLISEVLISLVDIDPREVLKLLLGSYRSTKVGCRLIDRAPTNIPNVITLLLCLIKTEPHLLLEDFETNEDDSSSDSDVRCEDAYKNIHSSVIRLLFEQGFPNTPQFCRNLSSFLLIAVRFDREKIDFLLKSARRNLNSIGQLVSRSLDPLSICRYALLLDEMNASPSSSFLEKCRVANVAGQIVDLVKSDLLDNAEKKEIATLALKAGSTLNWLINSTHSPAERSKKIFCFSFSFFHEPKDYFRDMEIVLERCSDERIGLRIV